MEKMLSLVTVITCVASMAIVDTKRFYVLSCPFMLNMQSNPFENTLLWNVIHGIPPWQTSPNLYGFKENFHVGAQKLGNWCNYSRCGQGPFMLGDGPGKQPFTDYTYLMVLLRLPGITLPVVASLGYVVIAEGPIGQISPESLMYGGRKVISSEKNPRSRWEPPDDLFAVPWTFHDRKPTAWN